MKNSIKRSLAVVGMTLATGASVMVGAAPAQAEAQSQGLASVAVQLGGGGGYGNGGYGNGGYGNGGYGNGGYGNGWHGNRGYGNRGFGNSRYGHGHGWGGYNRYRYVDTFETRRACEHVGRRGEWRGAWSDYVCVRTRDNDDYGNRSYGSWGDRDFALLVKRRWH